MSFGFKCLFCVAFNFGLYFAVDGPAIVYYPIAFAANLVIMFVIPDKE